MRTDLPVGIQLFNLRDEAVKDLKGTLTKVKELGFDFVELAGLYGKSAEEFKKVLDEVGISALSAHVSYDELKADPVKTLETYRSLGVRYVVFPYLAEDVRQGTAEFENTLKTMRHICEIAKDMGIVMLYHNHDFEFVRLENGQFGLDHMYEQIPSELLQAELDLCWVKVAGQDPVEYLTKYQNRIPIVHLKDFYKEGIAENHYELIGSDRKDPTKGSFFFRPLSYGMQFWPPILDAAKKNGAKYLIYEQDKSYELTPLENAKLSIRYLKG